MALKRINKVGGFACSLSEPFDTLADLLTLIWLHRNSSTWDVTPHRHAPLVPSMTIFSNGKRPLWARYVSLIRLIGVIR